jgi:hypothetical protein
VVRTPLPLSNSRVVGRRHPRAQINPGARNSPGSLGSPIAGARFSRRLGARAPRPRGEGAGRATRAARRLFLQRRREIPGLDARGESRPAVAAVAEGFVRRIAAATQPDGRPSPKTKSTAGRVFQLKLAGYDDGPVIVEFNLASHVIPPDRIQSRRARSAIAPPCPQGRLRRSDPTDTPSPGGSARVPRRAPGSSGNFPDSP